MRGPVTTWVAGGGPAHRIIPELESIYVIPNVFHHFLFCASAQVQGEYERSLKLARKVLRDIENWTDDDLHNKPEMVATLHSSMGNAYLELGQYEKALKEHNKDLEIAEAELVKNMKYILNYFCHTLSYCHNTVMNSGKYSS